jgi:IS605 OrfB family transposase
MQQKAARDQRKWLTGFDLIRLTTGASGELGLSSNSICDVCLKYVKSRSAKHRPWLRFRGRHSLGWVPFHQKCVRFDGDGFIFRGTRYQPMHLRDIPEGLLPRGGSFSQDSKGHWYINVTTDVTCTSDATDARVGVDLGLKSLLTLSDGRSVEAPRFYRQSEAAIATATRRRKTKRLRAIHAKIANRRQDFIHKLSNQLTKEYGLIVVGDVSPSKLARTRMAKSVYDASWSDLKAKLLYKSIRNGGTFLEVSECYTTQTCSSCGSKDAPERPRGTAGLSKRGWRCECGAVHGRDQNAAINILRAGLGTLEAGAATKERSSQIGASSKALLKSREAKE